MAHARFFPTQHEMNEERELAGAPPFIKEHPKKNTQSRNRQKPWAGKNENQLFIESIDTFRAAIQ